MPEAPTLVVGTTEAPALVHGVHGAAGQTSWTCFTRRAGLDGDWEAVEWASVPPGGISGEHLHTRTEEVYFLLSGRARIFLDGRPTDIEPGHTVLTKVGTRHALHNIGDEPVSWLVIEILSPQVARALAVAGHPADATHEAGEAETVDSTVINLGELVEFDPRKVFAGPLDLIRIETLEPGRELDLAADGCEHTLFVLRGEGSGHGPGPDPVPLRPGTSVTVPYGGRVRVRAGADGIEFFRARMAVDGGPRP